MISEIIISAVISLTPADKKIVNNLESRLKKDGYDISKYVNDSRFQIYKFEEGKRNFDYSDTINCWYLRKGSLNECADFIEENWILLDRVKKDFDISPEQIASQLQLESRLGKYTGKYSAFNAMVSKYLDRKGKDRETFYKYLRDYLKLCADTTDDIILSSDVFENFGSNAGAIGIAQIMSSNMDNYMVDYNNDGKRDPNNKEDAVGTVARFLNRNELNAQKYNPYDKFYGSSIGKHTRELMKIMDKRSTIPPEKISCKIKPSIDGIDFPKIDTLQERNFIAMVQQIPPKQPFIKRILPNLRIGRR
jgi:hypothetical protein